MAWPWQCHTLQRARARRGKDSAKSDNDLINAISHITEQPTTAWRIRFSPSINFLRFVNKTSKIYYFLISVSLLRFLASVSQLKLDSMQSRLAFTLVFAFTLLIIPLLKKRCKRFFARHTSPSTHGAFICQPNLA